ncbi:hypothetical protein HPP92_009861 [Vanilla planifolia]|uniref:Chlororespiratory reduction 4 n=1 Tax=Vanilla planifolia TaxID=51239 RepID=A0A835V987_VANPL|nr:hypothetical protein HPP92_009861 [Vanilla planifolia]
MHCRMISIRFVCSVLNPSTIAVWNSIIRASIDKGLHHKSLLHYRRMRRAGILPNHLTFPVLLKACVELSEMHLSPMIHTHVLKSPSSSDVYVGTSMINLYAKCQRVDSAKQVFDEMHNKDVITWNAMIMGFSMIGSHWKVFLLFHEMKLDEIEPDKITIMSLSQSCAKNKDAWLLKVVHSMGIKSGLGEDVLVSNSWISSYTKCEDLVSAELLFEEIPAASKSIVSWNSMIAGCGQLQRTNKVCAYFVSMLQEGLRPDLSTILSLLSSLGHSECLVLGVLVHSMAIKVGYEKDINVSNTLISFYSKCGDVVAARYCFNSMNVRTCVSWTVIISCYAKAGDINEVMDLFHEMENVGEKADPITVVSVLSACSQTGSLEFGRSMERYVKSNMFSENTMVCNGLIDMYAKCGSILDARRVFESMNGRSIVSWTALIMGCAMNGDYEEALSLFSQMLELQIRPNHVTFLAVLQACTHGGFLERGQDLFNMMTNVYRIEPRLEHYACMADLLGKRGKINKALEFINSMPIEQDCGVWGALLGSCIIHQETEIGEYAARRLFELKPNVVVPYVAMANIYASRGLWDGMAKVRAMMRKKGLQKSPGQSIVQVNGKAHAFAVEDRIHPEGSIIYEVLDILALHLRLDDPLEHLAVS